MKAEDGRRPEEIGIVLRAMDVVASEARHAVGVHQAGNEIVPLHSVSTPGAVGKIRGIGSNTYTVIVEPAGKGFQFVFIRRLNPSAVLRFVTPAGLELERWDESALPKQFSNTVPPGARIRLPNGQIIRQ